MSRYLNRVELIGNVGKDPEIRSTQGGIKVASFSVATTETWKDRQTGERKERTEWHKVVVFNEGLVQIVERFMKKGSFVRVLGALQTRKWTDNAGQERYTTEIVLQKFRGEIGLLDAAQGRDEAPETATGYGPGTDDDEMPF